MAKNAPDPVFFRSRRSNNTLHPLLALSGALTGMGQATSGFAQASVTQAGQQAQTEAMRLALQEEEARRRQAMATLGASGLKALSGQLGPQAQSQVGSVMAGVGDARQRPDMGVRMAEAPIAAERVQLERTRKRVLQEVDRLEQEIAAPVAEGSSIDPEVTAASRSGIQTLRAQIESAPDIDSIGNVAQLSKQLGLDGAGRLAMSLDVERVRMARTAAQQDGVATRILAQRPGWESIGPLAQSPYGVEGAAKTLFALEMLREEEASQKRVIGAREASERRLQAGQEEAQAAAAYQQVFSQQLSLLSQAEGAGGAFGTNLIEEAKTRALAVIEATNPAVAKRIEANGTAATVERYVRGMEAARGYITSYIQNNSERLTEEGSRGISMTGINLFDPPGLKQERLQRALTSEEIRTIEAATIQHLQLQYGMPRALAQQAYRQSRGNELLLGYNESVREQRKPARVRDATPPISRDPLSPEMLLDASRNFPHPRFELEPKGRPAEPEPETSLKRDIQFWNSYFRTTPPAERPSPARERR